MAIVMLGAAFCSPSPLSSSPSPSPMEPQTSSPTSSSTMTTSSRVSAPALALPPRRRPRRSLLPAADPRTRRCPGPGAGESNAVQLTLEHDLGGGKGFVPAGTFSARHKTFAHGTQTLTKLRFTRNYLTEDDKVAFKPSKWTFSSYTILKIAEQAPRTPSFADQLIEADNGLGEVIKPPEKSFWAKYWMYIIPLGLIVMNAVMAAANLPEEAAGQGQPGAQRAPDAAAAGRRR